MYSTVSPTPTEPHSNQVLSYLYSTRDIGLYFSEIIFPKIKMTAATYKRTALKVLVLWNLPALLLLAGAFQVGSSVIV